MHVEARGKAAEVGFSLPDCESQGLNSGFQVWLKAPLLTEPSRYPDAISSNVS